MTRYRIRVGYFESDLNEEELTSGIEEALSKLGKISEVENRGLLVSKIRHGGRQGEVNLAIIRTILDADQPMSQAKIGRALPDLDPKQVTNALSRMLRQGELEYTRTNRKTGKYWYYVYTVTEKGIDKLEEVADAKKNARVNALKLWAWLKGLEFGVTRGLEVTEAMAKSAGLTPVEFRFAWSFLVDKGKAHRIYPGQPGSTNRKVKYIVGKRTGEVDGKVQ